MAVNFLQNVYKPAFDLFARPITILPRASQPGAAMYDGRGIFDSNDQDIDDFGMVVVTSSARIELDILIDEFPILPNQKDLVYIPFNADVDGGNFEVADLTPNNAGGELTLQLKRLEDSALFGYALDPGNGFTLGAPEYATPTLTVT